MSNTENVDCLRSGQASETLFGLAWSRLVEARERMDSEQSDKSGDDFALAERLFLSTPALDAEQRAIKAEYIRREFVESKDDAPPGGELLDIMMRSYVEELRAAPLADLVAQYHTARRAADDAEGSDDAVMDAATDELYWAELAVLNCPVADHGLCEAQRSIINEHADKSGPFERAMLAASMRIFDRYLTSLPAGASR